MGNETWCIELMTIGGNYSDFESIDIHKYNIYFTNFNLNLLAMLYQTEKHQQNYIKKYC